MTSIAIGNRVIYHSEFGDIKGQVQRVFKHKVQILTSNLEKVSAPIDDVEIAPLPGKKVKRQEQATPAPTLNVVPPTDDSSAKSSGGNKETWDANQTAEEAAAQFRVGDRVIISQGIPSERYGVIVKFTTCNGHSNMPLVLGDDGIRRFEPPQLMKKVPNGLLFPLDEFDATIAQMEEEIEECSHSLTCAAELEPDLRLQDCSLDSTSLESQKLTSTAQTFSESDSPESITTETCKQSEYLSAEESASLQAHLPASLSQSRETGSVQLMSETASPQLSEQLTGSTHISLRSKTFQDCSTAPGDRVMEKGLTSTIFCVTFPRAGMMQNGSWSVAAALERPGLGSDCCWLESPGALSCPGKNRPPGLSRLEGQLKRIAALAPGEVLNPEFLEQSFLLGIGWTDPQDGRSALEFLQKMGSSAIAEPLSVTPLTQKLQPSPSAESSTCPSCEAPLLKLDDGCGTCGWQPDNRHRSQQPQNPPEPKQPRASGWLEPYIKNKKLKSGVIASYPKAEGHRNPDDPHDWYWAYKYEEKSENAISDNGCITRAVSVPARKVLGVRNAIANRQPVQKVLQFIRGEI